MRLLLLSICFLCIVSCDNNTEKTKNPAFLIGNWKRLNDKPGSQTFENWNSDFKGLSYTIKDGKTTFSKQLSIIKINDTLHLQVVGVNENPTLFKFTKQTDTSFVCENPQNEFPKKITYLVDNNQLKAIVQNDDFRIDFIFEKEN